MAKKSSEVEALLKKYPNPKSVQGARMLKNEGLNELTKAYPELSGFLESALMGTAPDEMGSVLDPTTAGRRAGAEYGFPAGIAAQVAPLLSPLSKFARGVAAAPSMMPGSMAAQRGVIKAPGGNWLAGSVEDALRGLKPRIRTEGVNGHTADNVATDQALNSWIDKQLTRYVKNDMATPNDPVRALAERGVLHMQMPENQLPADLIPEGIVNARKRAGFPEHGMGVSPGAQDWELRSDAFIRSDRAGDLLKEAQEKGYDRTLNQNPWLAKVPAETPVNATEGSNRMVGLELDHLIDELRNATNPASGLPLDLQLKYSSLNQVSVPQAVERVAAINAWRAAQKAEADAARAMNPATHVFKEYAENNPKGFKWVELKSPDSPGGSELAEGRLKSKDYTALQDALKYEGDTMGHCVGGYCDDVASGASRIYSLRSGKGQPHVTVEVKPKGAVFSDVAKHIGREEAGRLLDQGVTLSEMIKGIPDFKYPESIIQIKGKGNKPPADEYLPYVQDFVKSGKWSDVGDLQNTGLINFKGGTTRYRSSPGMPPAEYSMPSGYMTSGEAAEHLIKQGADESWARQQVGDFKGLGYAKGGLVKQKAKPVCGCEHNYADGGLLQAYDPAAVDAHVARLRAEFAL